MSDELDSFPPMHPNIQGIGRERARKTQQGAESVPPQPTPAVSSVQSDTDPDLLAAPRFASAPLLSRGPVQWMENRARLLVVIGASVAMLLVLITGYMFVASKWQRPGGGQATTVRHSATQTPTGTSQQGLPAVGVPTQGTTQASTTPTATPQSHDTPVPGAPATKPPQATVQPQATPTPNSLATVPPQATATPSNCNNNNWYNGPNTNSYTVQSTNNYNLTVVLQGLYDTVNGAFCGEFRTVDIWWIPNSSFSNGVAKTQTLIYNGANQISVNQITDDLTFNDTANTTPKSYGSAIKGTCARGIGTVTATSPASSPVQASLPWSVANQDANGNHIWCP